MFLAIAEAQNEIIGIVRFCVENSTPLLRSMLVIPQYRKKGIGKLLLNVFEGHLDENKIAGVCCIPWKKLEGFYSKIGFYRCPPSNAPLFIQKRLLAYQEQENDEIIFMTRD